jgi:hypothetical protein
VCEDLAWRALCQSCTCQARRVGGRGTFSINWLHLIEINFQQSHRNYPLSPQRTERDGRGSEDSVPGRNGEGNFVKQKGITRQRGAEGEKRQAERSACNATSTRSTGMRGMTQKENSRFWTSCHGNSQTGWDVLDTTLSVFTCCDDAMDTTGLNPLTHFVIGHHLPNQFYPSVWRNVNLLHTDNPFWSVSPKQFADCKKKKQADDLVLNATSQKLDLWSYPKFLQTHSFFSSMHPPAPAKLSPQSHPQSPPTHSTQCIAASCSY